MSTSYEVQGQGVRLTRRKIESIARQAGGSVSIDPDDKHLIVQIPQGYVHHYGGDIDNPRTAWNGFERFGGNGAAAAQWCEYLNACGYSIMSEHGPVDYFGLRG